MSKILDGAKYVGSNIAYWGKEVVGMGYSLIGDAILGQDYSVLDNEQKAIERSRKY